MKVVAGNLLAFKNYGTGVWLRRSSCLIFVSITLLVRSSSPLPSTSISTVSAKYAAAFAKNQNDVGKNRGGGWGLKRSYQQDLSFCNRKTQQSQLCYSRQSIKPQVALDLSSSSLSNPEDDKSSGLGGGEFPNEKLFEQDTNIKTNNNDEKKGDVQRSQGVGLTQLLSSVSSLGRQCVTALARLSLEDSKWRRDAIQQNRADRMMEVSLARMLGEEAPYLRPMDAAGDRLGPLGKMEQNAVQWVLDVIEEETARAQAIIDRSGKLVRPLDVHPGISLESTDTLRSSQYTLDSCSLLADHTDYSNSLNPNARMSSSNTSTITAATGASSNTNTTSTVGSSFNISSSPNTQDLGPLGRFEKRVVEFYQKVKDSEEYRFKLFTNASSARGSTTTTTPIIRPKDVEPRGPLGEWEYQVTIFLQRLVESEELRYHLQQGRLPQRNKSLSRSQQSVQFPLFIFSSIAAFRWVRPIDVPGPLGELESSVGRIVRAEQRRVQEGMFKRPKDASIQGPLGQAESIASDAIQQLNLEETERFKNIKRSIQEKIASSCTINNSDIFAIKRDILSQTQEREDKGADFLATSPVSWIEMMIVGIVRGPIVLINVLKHVYELTDQISSSRSLQDQIHTGKSSTSKKPQQIDE